MGDLTILCEVPFSANDERELATAAAALKVTKEEFIKDAVKFYAAKCVPTQKKRRRRLTA